MSKEEFEEDPLLNAKLTKDIFDFVNNLSDTKKEEPNPIHKFNNGKGATLCGECYVIISEGLTEDLYCGKCKPNRWLNSLVESWQKRQREYEALAERHRDSEHTYKKYTYRAQATRDCWKELLTLTKKLEL